MASYSQNFRQVSLLLFILGIAVLFGLLGGYSTGAVLETVAAGILFYTLTFRLKQLNFNILKTVWLLIVLILSQAILYLHTPISINRVPVPLKTRFFWPILQISEFMIFALGLFSIKRGTVLWHKYPVFLSAAATIALIFATIFTINNTAISFHFAFMALVLFSIPILLTVNSKFTKHHLIAGLFCFLFMETVYSVPHLTKPVPPKHYTFVAITFKCLSWLLLYRLMVVAPGVHDFSKAETVKPLMRTEHEPYLPPCNECTSNLRAALEEIHSQNSTDTLLYAIVKNAVHLTNASGGEIGFFNPKTHNWSRNVQYLDIPFSLESFYDYHPVMQSVALSGKSLVTGISSQNQDIDYCFILAAPLSGFNPGVVLVANIGSQFSSINQVHFNLFTSQASVAIKRTKLLEDALRQAQTDSLTGLYNHRHFFELARKEISRSQRYKHPLTALMIDIDHFKEVNDTYGHPAGDQVLVTVANLCRKLFRNIDIVGRYGGEEFAVLLTETPTEKAVEVAERLRQTIQKTSISYHRKRISVTVSLGVASLRADCTSINRLIEQADTALYHAKAQGRNVVCLWKASMCYVGAMKRPQVNPRRIVKPLA